MITCRAVALLLCSKSLLKTPTGIAVWYLEPPFASWEPSQRWAVFLESEAVLNDGSDFRKATNIFQYFKDSKFSGDISQSIELTIRDYIVCVRQRKFTPNQKADLFINTLADPARTYFFNLARDNMSFEEMAAMMVSQYNNGARQLKVQGVLETLRLVSTCPSMKSKASPKAWPRSLISLNVWPHNASVSSGLMWTRSTTFRRPYLVSSGRLLP